MFRNNVVISTPGSLELSGTRENPVIRASDTLTILGRLSAAESLTIEAPALVTRENQLRISTDGSLLISENDQVFSIASVTKLTISRLDSDKNISVLAPTIVVEGDLTSDRDVRLRGNTVFFNRGSRVVGRHVDCHADQIVNHEGAINSTNSINMGL